MSKLQEYERFKRIADSRKAELERARGAYQAHLDRICREYGVTSVEEAKALEAKLRKECDKLEADFDAAFSKFKKEHPDVA